jgi:3-hydroxyacyl-[acyl-carrier-protein] dehydratase
MTDMDNFYNIISRNVNGDDVEFEIELNKFHDIFKGHFPEEPITPGVCVVKIALELASIAFCKKFQIKSAKNIKFLNIISPLENPVVCFRIHRESANNDSSMLTIVVFHDDMVFVKIKMEVC